MREEEHPSITAVAEPSPDMASELECFAVYTPRLAVQLSRVAAVRMGKLVTVSMYLIGTEPQGVFTSTKPARGPDDARIMTYADRALDLVTERSEQRQARSAELSRTDTAVAESRDYFAQRLQGLREAFQKELLVCDPRQNREVVARYIRNRDDLMAAMQLVQARADEYPAALLNRYPELSDEDIHYRSASAHQLPYEETNHDRAPAAARNFRRTRLHRLKVGFENYSDALLGTLGAWWWHAGDVARWFTHARRP